MVVGHEYPRGWGGGEGGAMLPRKFFEINSRQEPITLIRAGMESGAF